MAILNRFNRDEIGNTIEVLVALLDGIDPDPDLEETGDDELTGDETDAAYVEWPTMRGSQKRGPNILAGHEDDEEDDPAGQYDEDYHTGQRLPARGAGCPIADPGGCEHDGREEDHDAEREQMQDDVPMLAVVSLEHNIFNDRRTPLGISNLMSSFVGAVRSADSGAMHRGGATDLQSTPGSPL